MKLSDLTQPEDFLLIDGAIAVVAHVNKEGDDLYEPLCVAWYSVEQGFFITKDEIGLHAVNHGESDGDVWFYILPKSEIVWKLLG